MRKVLEPHHNLICRRYLIGETARTQRTVEHHYYLPDKCITIETVTKATAIITIIDAASRFLVTISAQSRSLVAKLIPLVLSQIIYIHGLPLWTMISDSDLGFLFHNIKDNAGNFGIYIRKNPIPLHQWYVSTKNRRPCTALEHCRPCLYSKSRKNWTVVLLPSDTSMPLISAMPRRRTWLLVKDTVYAILTSTLSMGPMIWPNTLSLPLKTNWRLTHTCGNLHAKLVSAHLRRQIRLTLSNLLIPSFGHRSKMQSLANFAA